MRDARRTILQLTLHGDGAGSTKSILSLSEQLGRRGHHVLVGCRAESALYGLARAAGLETVALDFTGLGRLSRAVAELIERRGVEIVNTHATRDGRALTWLRLRRALPQALVVTRRSVPLTSRLELPLVGWAADRTIAVSGAVAGVLARRWHPTARLRVVPDGIDLARLDAPVLPAELAAARAVLGEPDGRHLVVVAACRKDQHVLLEGLSGVQEPSLVACVGIEPDAQLLARAAAVPPRHRVVFVPFVPRPLAFYSMADAAAFPTRVEGYPEILLEAMALGIPVLAFDAWGNSELVTDGVTGLLIAPHDAAAWTRGLSRVLGSPDLAQQMARAGRVLVRREYTLERAAERTEVVYREALARRARLLRWDGPM